MKRGDIKRAALVSALRKTMDGKLEAIKPGAHRAEVTFPAPVVQNHIPAPNVNVTNRVEPTPINNQTTVDMTPIAAALDRMSQEIGGQNELLSQLVQVLSEQKPVEFKPVINLPEPVVTVSPPEIKVDVAEAPRRRIKRARIKHGDGTESTITLEE